MTAMTFLAPADKAPYGLGTADDLYRLPRDRVVLPGDDRYAVSRQVWNGAVDRRPAAIVSCETAADVAIAVSAAGEQGLPLSVRGGGHDWAGRALCDDGLVIDLAMMRRIDINSQTRVATVGGGARGTDLIAAAARYGLAPVTGNCGSVGMAGLTLGGGYGPLSPRYGLAADNLLGAEIVLADGRRVTANALDHPDLYWALRGGGGNFGVVTAMRISLHPVHDVLAGFILFPWAEADVVLRRYAELVSTAPDHLEIATGLIPSPDGDPMLFLAPTWCGLPALGQPILDRLRRFGTPVVARVGLMTCADLAGMYDAEVVRGRHYAIQTRWLAEMTEEAIDWIVAAGSHRTSRYSALVIRHFHGQPARIAPRETAFGLRREHFLVEAIAAWEPGNGVDGPIHRQWARRLSEALAPIALPGGYANILGPDEHEQIAHTYGDNIVRLRRVKRVFDPDGVFSAIPLPL
jgi:FAD/FMN-containing dehydrogenase